MCQGCMGRRVKKEKWEHRSKKERKVAKERKVVEKDMAEADASVSYEERDKMQSETLKMVFHHVLQDSQGTRTLVDGSCT